MKYTHEWLQIITNGTNSPYLLSDEDVVMVDLDVESASGNVGAIQNQSMEEDFLPDIPYGNATMLLILFKK